MHIYTQIHVHLCVHILYIDFSSTPKLIPAGSGNLSFCLYQILEWLPTWVEIKIFIFIPGNSGKITMLAQKLSSYRSRWPIYFTYMGKIPWHHIIPMCFFNSAPWFLDSLRQRSHCWCFGQGQRARWPAHSRSGGLLEELRWAYEK
jgi:hypothetical protein